MGRPVLWAGEIMRMNYAENLVDKFRARAKSNNWVAWAVDNPYWAREITELESMNNG